MDNEIYKSDELIHWGIKGMRWGIRRYQRKDGSLTPAGEKRLKAERAALKKEEQVLKNRKSTKAKFDRIDAKRKALAEEKKALDDAERPKIGNKGKLSKKAKAEAETKKLKDMTDDEIRTAIARKRLEQEYSTLTANSETSGKGKGFVRDFWDKSAVPAIQEAGKGLIKDSLTKVGKKYLGLDVEKVEDEVAVLKRQYDKMNYEDKIRGLKAKVEKASEKARAEEAEKKAKAEAKDEKKKQSETYRSKGGETTETGRSAASSSMSGLPAKISSVSSNTTNRGRSSVAGLLEGSTTTRRSDSEKLATYDENGNFIGYWSEPRGESDGII